MAITKLTAQTTAQDMTPLLDILQTHAVPAYFDSVELVEGDTNQSISCKVGGTEILRIWRISLVRVHRQTTALPSPTPTPAPPSSMRAMAPPATPTASMCAATPCCSCHTARQITAW